MFSNQYVCQEVVRDRQARYEAEARRDHEAKVAAGERNSAIRGWLNSLFKVTASRPDKRSASTSPVVGQVAGE